MTPTVKGGHPISTTALRRRTRVSLPRWLASLPNQAGLPCVSSPKTFGNAAGETDYASQFVVDDRYIDSMSLGLGRVLAATGADRGGPALEFGCGTGIFTRALLRGTDYPHYYITDMSDSFLTMTRRVVESVEAGAAANAAVDYVVLDTEDAACWPRDSVSLVALRYVLHHVLDWERFIAESAALLRPGGVLTFEEPCSDGYLLQVMMLQVARRQAAAAPMLTPQVERDLDAFDGLTMWYLRTDADKSASEDKHVFRVSELISLGHRLGLDVTVYPNLGYDEIHLGVPPPNHFVREFRHNLQTNFGFGQETLEFFDRWVAPACGQLAALSGSRMGPFVKAVFVMQRPPLLVHRLGQDARSSCRAAWGATRRTAARRLPESARRRLRRHAGR